MNKIQLKKADKLLLKLQEYCDNNNIDIDNNIQYIELNKLVTEYEINNQIKITKVIKCIKSTLKHIKKKTKQYLTTF